MTRYRMDFYIPNLNRIDDGVIATPADWEIQEWVCDPRPDVERYWIEDGSAPGHVEGKLVDVVITREGASLDVLTDGDKVYISEYKVLEG